MGSAVLGTSKSALASRVYHVQYSSKLACTSMEQL